MEDITGPISVRPSKKPECGCDPKAPCRCGARVVVEESRRDDSLVSVEVCEEPERGVIVEVETPE